jgi:hypothetical protein
MAGGIVAYHKDPGLSGRAISSSRGLLSSVSMELALGFLLAGLIEALLPRHLLPSWLGDDHLISSAAIGWMAGLALPGDPYVAFPQHKNSGKPLSDIRMVTYEAPVLGWPARLGSFCTWPVHAANSWAGESVALHHNKSPALMP